MGDLDRLLADLERMLLDVLRLAETGGGTHEEIFSLGQGEINVSASVRVGFLDESPPTYPVKPGAPREPLIDVIKSEDGFRVLVDLPGISKDDVKVSVRDQFLVFDIETRGRTYHNEVPCPMPPRRVTVKSVVENNSVVEIFLGKGRASPR